jgi:hypothetical protein
MKSVGERLGDALENEGPQLVGGERGQSKETSVQKTPSCLRKRTDSHHTEEAILLLILKEIFSCRRTLVNMTY